MSEAKPLTQAEIEAEAKALSFEVFAAGCWLEDVDSEVCPEIDQLMLNASVGVLRLLFLQADEQGVAPEVVIQAVGFAVGDRSRPTPVLHAHARAVLLEGFRQGVTGDTIGETEGAA